MFDVALSTLAAQAFTGLVLGGILVLMAIGLSLIFGLMTVVNFAHGSLYMLGAFCAFSVLAYTKSFWAALILAPLMVGVFGFAQYNHWSIYGSDAGTKEPSRLSSTGTRGK